MMIKLQSTPSLWSILIGIALILSGCGGSSGIDPLPEDSDEPGWHEGRLQHDGLERAFRFYLPEDLPQDAPTVVLLHGGTQSMDAIFRSRAGGTNEWPAIAEEEKFMLLVPNGTNPDTGSPTGNNQFWNDCRAPGTIAGSPQSTADDVGFIMELKEWAAFRFASDSNRFYVTGASNGGQMAYRLALEQPNQIAGIAAFIANLPVESECDAPSAPVPVFMANGTEDPIIPFDGGDEAGRGPFLSAPATRSQWAQANNADTTQRTETELPDRDPDDGNVVICEDDPAGDAGAPVRFCRIEGGGHAMPSIEHRIPRLVDRRIGPQNRDVEGARLAWEFLRDVHR
ncbi:MAG: PHB depolymerase family esterase [Longimonas sp.]|uniref:alpha/beta hydrolase family esterase n=1 Tax=Longimonas sp. TaxID=2039626 RepID=UPI00397534FA